MQKILLYLNISLLQWKPDLTRHFNKNSQNGVYTWLGQSLNQLAWSITRLTLLIGPQWIKWFKPLGLIRQYCEQVMDTNKKQFKRKYLNIPLKFLLHTRKPSCTVGRNVNWYSHYEEQSRRFLIKLKIWPCNPTPEKNMIWKDTCTPVFIAALFTIAKTWKQPKCPSTEKWIKNMSWKWKC